MYFNKKPFNAHDEAKDLANSYFVKIFEYVKLSGVSSSWLAAKRCALDRVKSLIPLLENLGSPDVENYKLILNELENLNS
jgi:hypothetical protein